ncbi:MAG: hypothetical protein CME71_04310 [Halobacteriovorax sp.]|nr:hypothetical protein [Halobacteriovorax sp.]
MLFGVFIVTALALEIDSGLITYAALGVFVIELMSSQKQKTLQTAVLLGLVVSPFHTWQLAALLLICLASQFQKNAETLRSYAAILALFSCLIVASDLTLITIIFIGLLYILNDKNRLEPLC